MPLVLDEPDLVIGHDGCTSEGWVLAQAFYALRVGTIVAHMMYGEHVIEEMGDALFFWPASEPRAPRVAMDCRVAPRVQRINLNITVP